MIYEMIFLIPEIILGIGIDFLLILRFAKNKEIAEFKGDINIGPLNKKNLSIMSDEMKKEVTKITRNGTLVMLTATVGVAITFIYILKFSKWFAILCVAIQLALSVFLYRHWREKAVECLKK